MRKVFDTTLGHEEYEARATLNHTTASGLFLFTANIAPRIAYRDIAAAWGCVRNAIEANPTTPLMNPNDPSKYYNFSRTNRQAIIRLK